MNWTSPLSNHCGGLMLTMTELDGLTRWRPPLWTIPTDFAWLSSWHFIYETQLPHLHDPIYEPSLPFKKKQTSALHRNSRPQALASLKMMVNLLGKASDRWLPPAFFITIHHYKHHYKHHYSSLFITINITIHHEWLLWMGMARVFDDWPFHQHNGNGDEWFQNQKRTWLRCFASSQDLDSETSWDTEQKSSSNHPASYPAW